MSDSHDGPALPPENPPEALAPVAEYVTEPPPLPAPRRIPNLGHAALFVIMACFFLFLSELVVILIGGPPASVHNGVTTILHPKMQIAAEGATYFLTVLAAWIIFPLFWHRRFTDGLSWNWPAARSQAARLIAMGYLLGAMSAVVDYFIKSTKAHPIDDFFLTQSAAWLITFFGIFVAPLFEEICFRGFLVPAFAIAYDWLSLPRTDEGRARWQGTTALSPASLVFSAILSSICFALLHGQQIGYAWNALTVLFCVSLVLTFVRIKTQSVAASTMVHAAYNSLIFLMTIIGTSGYRHLDHVAK